MGALQDVYPKIRALDAELIAVSPQNLEHTRQTQKDLDLSYVLLSDQENRAAERFGLKFAFTPQARKAYQKLGIVLPEFNGEDSWTLPVPATYVVDSSHTIAYSHVDSDYTKRPEPHTIIETLQSLRSS